MGAVLQRVADYIELTKFRLVSLTLWSTAAGYMLGHRGTVDNVVLSYTLLGAGLVAAGSMSLNEWMEHREDAKMSRTAKRPLPAGRLRLEEAMGFGILLSLAGLGLLLLKVNALAAFLAWLTLITYVVVYTPLKKKTSYCTLIGAVPGALPPLIGWAAATGTLPQGAWVLFAIIFIWQMPHFFAISWFCREDYAAAGFKMLSVEDPSGRKLSHQMVLYTLLLVPVSLLPSFIGVAGKIYFWASLIMGIILAGFSFKMLRDLNRYARPFFRASLIYLTLLFIFMVWNKTL